MSEQVVRILHITGRVITGGVDGIVMDYYRHIDHSKIQFDFIMDGYNDTQIDDEIRSLGGKIYKVEPYTHNFIKNQHQIYRILKENHYKIVHSHMNTLNVFYLMQAKRAKTPICIAHSHSTAAMGEGMKTKIKHLLIPYSKIFPTHYAACSELAGKWLFGQNFYNSGNVFLMKNAVNIEKFSFNSEIRQQKRKALNLEDKFIIGHVGRFVYQKNHEFLIDIFYEIHNHNINSVLILAGSGELEPTIKEKVDKLGLTNSVLFLGVRHDIPELMQAMDVFVLPSFYEGLPIVGVEAQAAGLPCVLSDAITKETKITDLAEFLSLSEAPEKWAQKILSYNNDRSVKDKEIKNAGFEIQTAATELMKWYQKLNCEIQT